MSKFPDFNRLYNILSGSSFLSMQGLGKEVPFFIHTYDISRQDDVYTGIGDLCKRLVTGGVGTQLIGLYDMVIEHFTEKGELEELFNYEKGESKGEFLKSLAAIFNPDEVVKPYFRKKTEEDSFRLVIVYQVGEVFPFLRTHNLLNWLQSVIRDVPLVVFFPGDYITSDSEGFKLKLFGKFEGPYYRAFRLEDYSYREAIND